MMVNNVSSKAWELYIKVSDGEQYAKSGMGARGDNT